MPLSDRLKNLIHQRYYPKISQEIIMKKSRISVGQYHLQSFDNWEGYRKHLTQYIKNVKAENTTLLVMPEYAGLEMNVSPKACLEDQFEHVEQWRENYLVLCAELARENNLYIQSGTLPFKVRDKCWRNRAYFFHPEGNYDFQDKIYLTKFEKQTGLLEGGDQIKIIDSPMGKIGIVICYDIEFPNLIAKFVSAGVQLILVPSSTETMQGFNRVQISCRARAIENQIFVANSCTIRQCPWSLMVDTSVGCAGIFTPADGRFNHDGMLLLGELNTPEQYCVDIKFDDLEDARENGDMANYKDGLSPVNVTVKL